MALWDKCPRCGKMKQATEKTCQHCGVVQRGKPLSPMSNRHETKKGNKADV